MSDIVKLNKGSKIKAQTSVSKRRVSLNDDNTITNQMLRDGVITDSKMSNAGLNSVKLIDSGNSNRLQLQSDSTPDMTADRAVTVDSENLAATLRLQGLAKVLPCESYLVASDLRSGGGPAYGWHINGSSDSATISNWIGGYDLTRVGNLTQQANHLGNSVYCEFDGTNDYLWYDESGGAVFADNGGQFWSIWAYKSDWSTWASSQILMSRNAAGAGNGWILYVNSASKLIGVQVNAGSQVATADVTKLSSGWHHFAVNRGANTYLYIDGKWASTGDSNVLTPAGNLEIGSYGGGTLKWNGRLAEPLIDLGGGYTEDDVRKIYARGARRFAAYDSTIVTNYNRISIPANETVFWPQRALTVTGTNGWVTGTAYGYPYRDILGNWWLTFSVDGTHNNGAGSTLTFAGVTFLHNTACAVASNGGSWSTGTAAGSSIIITHGAAGTIGRISGTLPLFSQPNI